MKRVSLSRRPCPIARALDQVGDAWSLLILRDVTLGFRRFAELQERLAIAPNILTRRLAALSRHGLLERRRYAVHPARYDYLPTQKGLEVVPLLLVLASFGNRWLAGKGEPLLHVDPHTRRRLDPIVVDRRTRTELHAGNVAVAAGPGAPAAVRRALQIPLLIRGRPS